jgi:hypothetical protein
VLLLISASYQMTYLKFFVEDKSSVYLNWSAIVINTKMVIFQEDTLNVPVGFTDWHDRVFHSTPCVISFL